MKKVIIFLKILFLFLLGCWIEFFNFKTAPSFEIFKEIYPIEKEVELILHNFNGGIKISLWDTNAIKVIAEKRTYFRKEELNKVKISVKKIKFF